MVTILFTCNECGLIKAKAFVRDRAKGEDVVTWTKEAAYQAAVVHSLLSRDCKGQKCDLYVPYDEKTGAVGSSDK